LLYGAPGKGPGGSVTAPGESAAAPEVCELQFCWSANASPGDAAEINVIKAVAHNIGKARKALASEKKENRRD